jgi:outer membrane lipoprotein LolB
MSCLKILLNDLIPDYNLLFIWFFRLKANEMRCFTSRPAINFKLTNLVLISLLLMTSGCAIQPPISELEKTRNWETKKLILNKLNFWRLAGRMSVRHKSDAWSASLYWRQEQDSYNVGIVAPLSQGSIEINGNANAVTLKTSEDQVYSNDDVNLLMQQNLGWSIPVSVMQYWIKGLPSPELKIDKIILDDMGKLDELTQSNWHITYQAYTRKQGYDLPSRLQITRENLVIRLIINNWTISDGN